MEDTVNHSLNYTGQTETKHFVSDGLRTNSVFFAQYIYQNIRNLIKGLFSLIIGLRLPNQIK